MNIQRTFIYIKRFRRTSILTLSCVLFSFAAYTTVHFELRIIPISGCEKQLSRDKFLLCYTFVIFVLNLMLSGL